MKTAIALFFTLLISTAYGQNEPYQVLLDSAKTLFKEADNHNDRELAKLYYFLSSDLLERAAELNPKNSEVRYYLGYCYSRLNSIDGQDMLGMSLDLLFRTSEQFEKVIELTPKYMGEIVLLDPYSKLSAEWGSMAMKYWYSNQQDSAKWAYKEGKRRGGFGKFILALNKTILDVCSKNSILISSGDNYTIPLWYLQRVKNYRTDVAVVDVNLLNSSWYPTYLSKRNLVDFDLNDVSLDTIQYIKWSDRTITINNFSWTVKPSYYDQYLLRGNRIFLSLLKANKFQRDVYFTTGFPEDYRLNLKDYLNRHVVVDKLSVLDGHNMDHTEYKRTMIKALKLSRKLNLNSTDEHKIFDGVRYTLLRKVNDYLDSSDKEKATELMRLLDKYASENNYPYHDESGKKYADYLRQRL